MLNKRRPPSINFKMSVPQVYYLKTGNFCERKILGFRDFSYNLQRLKMLYYSIRKIKFSRIVPFQALAKLSSREIMCSQLTHKIPGMFPAYYFYVVIFPTIFCIQGIFPEHSFKIEFYHFLAIFQEH